VHDLPRQLSLAELDELFEGHTQLTEELAGLPDPLGQARAVLATLPGFRFVVFVNRRPRAEILSLLRERLQHSREAELGTGLDELVAIALDRWQSR
jgi:hypothetical protein